MTTIERYTEVVCNEISEVWDSKLDDAVRAATEIMNGTQTDDDYDVFYNVAQRIAEPKFNDSELDDEYYRFMEQDIENWASYIEKTFGPKWGLIANCIKEEGY